MSNDQIKAYVEKVVEIQDLTEKLKQWEDLADKLIHYAKAVRNDLTLKFKKFDENILLQINNAEDVIKQYEELKKL